MATGLRARGACLRAEEVWADRGAVAVLRGVSLALQPGELLAILGANGAGKSTLLLTLAGVIRPRRGRVFLNDRRIDGIATEGLVRRGVVLVPQGRHLFGALTVRENLQLADFARSPGAQPQTLEQWLPRFPEVARHLERPAGLLSGGQQQMVAIMRGLLSSPRVLLLDEPSAALASPVRRAMLATIRDLADLGVAVAVVEQEVDAVLEVADRSVVMAGGRLLEGRGLRDPARHPAERGSSA